MSARPFSPSLTFHTAKVTADYALYHIADGYCSGLGLLAMFWNVVHTHRNIKLEYENAVVQHAENARTPWARNLWDCVYMTRGHRQQHNNTDASTWQYATIMHTMYCVHPIAHYTTEDVYGFTNRSCKRTKQCRMPACAKGAPCAIA
jgi:hypothetical protein